MAATGLVTLSPTDPTLVAPAVVLVGATVAVVGTEDGETVPEQ